MALAISDNSWIYHDHLNVEKWHNIDLLEHLLTNFSYIVMLTMLEQ